jgi:hypothetical protein
VRRDPGTMARPRATRKPAQKNRGPSRPNLSGFGLSRKPPICPGLWGCFLFLPFSRTRNTNLRRSRPHTSSRPHYTSCQILVTKAESSPLDHKHRDSGTRDVTDDSKLRHPLNYALLRDGPDTWALSLAHGIPEDASTNSLTMLFCGRARPRPQLRRSRCRRVHRDATPGIARD